jgi:hypothetical protein
LFVVKVEEVSPPGIETEADIRCAGEAVDECGGGGKTTIAFCGSSFRSQID